MSEPLKCVCGSRRLIRTEIYGDDGNLWAGDWDEVLQCPACQRVLVFEETADGKVKLVAKAAHTSMVLWRSL